MKQEEFAAHRRGGAGARVTPRPIRLLLWTVWGMTAAGVSGARTLPAPAADAMGPGPRPTTVAFGLPPVEPAETPRGQSGESPARPAEARPELAEGVAVEALRGTTLQQEIARWTWQVAPVRVTPYGAFWADAVFASRRTVPGAFTLWVASREEEGESAFTLDVRRSRFGFRLDGPPPGPLGNARSAARLEFDFHGNFVTENRASVLLRHAYWELGNERYRLLVGQTWDVISPLNPGMVDYAVGWTAGNVGFRRSQVRAEHFATIAPAVELVLQGSLNQDIVTDFPTEPGVERESSNWPVLQARLALRGRDPASASGEAGAADASDWQLGISGHLGETGFDFLTAGPPPGLLPPEDDARFLTWSLNLDAHLPLGPRWGLQGELFMGTNLSAFLGGIGQGVCGCTRTSIRSRGGWLELWHRWNRQVHLHAGGGWDDPIDRDFEFGRTYNRFLFANLMLDLTDQISTGWELTVRKTLYQDRRVGEVPPELLRPTAPGNAVTLDWMVKYAF